MALNDEINKVKFISEDFATYRTEAENFYKNNYPESFNSLLNTDIGNALMDQLAFAMGALSFTINRRASELFLSTAKLNKSITKLARMLGYPINPASPAIIDLTINFPDAPYAFPVSFSRGFQFQGPGDIVYEYRNDVDAILNAGETNLELPVKEGRSSRLTFVSNGEPNQEFSIRGIPEDEFLYSDSMILTVDGIEWDRLDLIKYESSNTYEILFTEAPPKLRFGDGIAGNIPPEDAQIVLEFVYGKGISGSISSNQLTQPVNPIVVSGSTISMELSHDVAVTGENPEDIRHVRAFASSFFRTQNAAVVKSDYDTIAMLRPGVAVADAQIMRGVSGDLTIQSYFQNLNTSKDLTSEVNQKINQAGVSGLSYVGVSGLAGLYVSGTSGLFVDNISLLGVSGTEYLGVGVSGNVTGIEFLGVQGKDDLIVGGQGGLLIGGSEFVGVSGVEYAGVSGIDEIDALSQAAIANLDTGVSGLYGYLSQAFSDTSKANQCQIVVLSVDANNKYIAPTNTILTDVQTYVQSLADAVVTVVAVDGSVNIVEADVEIELGISPTAVESDIILQVENSLKRITEPYGLLVRRAVGKKLYLSDIKDAIRAETTSGDVRFINVKITNHPELLDEDGNMSLITKQQVIQNGSISAKVTKRFRRGEVY